MDHWYNCIRIRILFIWVSKSLASESAQLRMTRFFFLLATSMTSWAQICTDFCMRYSKQTGLWQLPIVSSVLKIRNLTWLFLGYSGIRIAHMTTLLHLSTGVNDLWIIGVFLVGAPLILKGATNWRIGG